MRFDEEIIVYQEVGKEYNEETGNLEDVGSGVGDKYWARVVKTPYENNNIISGRVKSGNLTLTVDVESLDDIEEVEVRGKMYVVEEYDEIRQRVYMVVSEV